MSDTQARELVDRIRQDMRQAIRDRDHVKLGGLRSLLARISNAEAVPQDSRVYDGGPIAGAKNGVGSTEVSRRLLTFTDIQMIIADEIAELQTALSSLDVGSAYAAELRQKIAVIEVYK